MIILLLLCLVSLYQCQNYLPEGNGPWSIYSYYSGYFVTGNGTTGISVATYFDPVWNLDLLYQEDEKNGLYRIYENASNTYPQPCPELYWTLDEQQSNLNGSCLYEDIINENTLQRFRITYVGVTPHNSSLYIITSVDPNPQFDGAYLNTEKGYPYFSFTPDLFIFYDAGDKNTPKM